MVQTTREKLSGLFDLRITLGTIIHIFILLAGIFAAWTQLKQNQEILFQQMKAFQAEYVRADVQAERDKAIIQRLDDIKEDVKGFRDKWPAAATGAGGR